MAIIVSVLLASNVTVIGNEMGVSRFKNVCSQIKQNIDEYFSLVKSDVYGHQIVTFTVDPRRETV